jgi:hypothetical protein
MGRSVEGILRAAGFATDFIESFAAGRPFGISSFHWCSSLFKRTQFVKNRRFAPVLYK